MFHPNASHISSATLFQLLLLYYCFTADRGPRTGRFAALWNGEEARFEEAFRVSYSVTFSSPRLPSSCRAMSVFISAVWVPFSRRSCSL